MFTYLPPIPSDPKYCFLGFSRYEKKDQITEEYWNKIACTVNEKVFARVQKEFNMCSCCSSSIRFASDETEVGVALKKLQQPMKTLFEIAEQQVEEKQLVAKLEEPVQKVVKKVIDISISSLYEKSMEIFFSEDPEEFHQIKINEFAVKVICEMCIEAEIDKKHILKQIQEAKKDGYLPAKSYYDLRSTIVKS